MNQRQEKFYFLNIDLPEKRTGIENSSLLRSRVFENELGITPTIVTAKYNPMLDVQRDKLMQQGLISENVSIINLYEYYQHRHSQKMSAARTSFKRVDRWTYKNIEGTHDYRIYDENGKQIIYRVCDEVGRLKFNNIFHAGKKIRRDWFHSDGCLSKVQQLNDRTGHVICETYFSTNGRVCIHKRYEPDTKGLMRIELIDDAGHMYAAFDTEEALFKYWLQELLSDDATNYLLIDKNKVFYPALKNWDASNIIRICCIHSTHFRGSEHYLGKIKSNYQKIFEDVYNPEAIVTLTSRQKKHIAERFSCEDNLYCIPHAIDKLPQTVEFQKRKRHTAIYLARFSPEKQQKNAVRMFGKVVKEIPDAELHLYGAGRGRSEVEEQIKALHLEENVFVHPYQSDVDAVYNNAQVAISTSRMEGFSLFILESIAHGCPVLSYDVDYGPRDMIDPDHNGMLVALDDEKQMATGLVRMFSDQKLLQNMSENAYDKAKSFSAREISLKWKGLIDDIRSVME